MRHPALTLRQAFGAMCACILLLPYSAAADPSLPIDIDRGGRRDRSVLDRRESPVLHVRSDTTQVIGARVPDDEAEPPGVIGTPFAPFALTLCASPRAPEPEVSAACAPRSDRSCRSVSAADPFAPRPPPAHPSL
jgi:hypothetical protein